MSVEDIPSLVHQGVKNEILRQHMNAQPKVVGVEIESGETPWCSIYLKDGNMVRVQVNISAVHRNDSAKGPDGMPEYILTAALNTQAFPRK